MNEKYPIRFDHNVVVEKYRKMGKAFAVFPFKSTIYVLGYGDNISAIYHNEHMKNDSKRFHPIAFLRKINPFDKKIVTKRVRREFGI